MCVKGKSVHQRSVSPSAQPSLSGLIAELQRSLIKGQPVLCLLRSDVTCACEHSEQIKKIMRYYERTKRRLLLAPFSDDKCLVQ